MSFSWLTSVGRSARRGITPAVCLVSALLTRSPATAAEPDPATRHEMWVPSRDLSSILKKHPDAVMLDRAQYEALIRDAGKIKPDEQESPPVKGVIQGVKVDVKVSGGAALANITAKLSLLNLVDGWVEHPLLTYSARIRLLRVDNQEVMLKSQAGQVLAVKGKGLHEVTLTFEAPIVREGTICHTEAPLLAHPVLLTVTPGQGVSFSKRWPIHNGVAEPPIAAGPLRKGVTPLYWLEMGDPKAQVTPIITEIAEVSARMDGAQVLAETRVHVRSASGPLPESLKFRLPDETSHVISVRDTGIASWTQHGSEIEIVRTGGLSPSRTFELTTERPTPEADGVTPLVIDVPKLESASRVTAYVTLSVSDLFEMTGWKIPPAPADPLLKQLTNKSAADLKVSVQSIAGAVYPVAPDKVEALVRRYVDRFSADVDTTIKLGSHEAIVDRALSFHGEEGSTVRATFELDKTEQFLTLVPAGGEAPQWKQLSPSNFEISWPQGLKKGQNSIIFIESRKDVSSGASEGKSTDKLNFENLRLPAATRLAGYVALNFDDSWKISTPNIVGLETRDARQTPVKGRMAWFALRDFQLGVQLTRNDTVLDAQVLAYALPRARNLEIEGQFTLTASQAPLRQFTVKLPPDIAPLLRFDSPLIGGQSLDQASGVWRLTLRKELEGSDVIRWRMSLPGHDAPKTSKSDSSNPSTTDMVITLPKFVLPEARHYSGEWVIEANTDTELHYTTKGVQPMDALHSPAVDGYAPRHRLLAAFAYGLGDHEITITASRHTPSTLVNAVVEQMILHSVLNKDGLARHRADLKVKHNGLQFFGVRLPADATLLSAQVDTVGIKPVRAASDEIRFPLPRLGHGGVDEVLLTLVYETKGQAWHSRGSSHVPAPIVDESVPVLTTQWRVFTPEGASVRAQGRLAEGDHQAVAPTLLGTLGAMGEWAYERLLPVSKVAFMPAGATGNYAYHGGGPFDNGGSAEPLISGDNYPFLHPGVTTPVAGNPLTPGLRSGTASITPDSINGLIAVQNVEVEKMKRTTAQPSVKKPSVSNELRRKAGVRSGAAAITPDSINGLIAQSDNGFIALPKAGLIALDVDVPLAGRLLDLRGNEKPTGLELHYATWENQMRHSLAFMALGALAFWFLARRHPWLGTLAAALLLTCLPLIWLPTFTVVCNALLAGWLSVLVIWTAWRLARAWERRQRRRRGLAAI